MIFDGGASEAFWSNYPDRPARLRHRLGEHPALSLESLIELTQILDPVAIEYNAGDLPVDQDPAKTPMNGLSASETVRRIKECNSWIVLKNIESEPAYRDLLETCLSNVADLPHINLPAMFKKQGFIFISSPGAVTPFHMDPEHNILMQVRGTKTMSVLPHTKGGIVSPAQHEAFHSAGGHRNLRYRKAHDMLVTPFELCPGDALYVPVKAPHWVKVGAEVSISLSITWRSRAADNEARLHKSNAWLRARGAAPPAAGTAPLRDRLKILAHRAATRMASG